MPQDITRATFRILSNATGEGVGTGFLVASQLLVTCAHVAEAAVGEKLTGSSKPHVVIDQNGQRVSAEIIPDAFSPVAADDVAFLRLETALAGTAPLRLGSAAHCGGHSYATMGFPRPVETIGHSAHNLIEGFATAVDRRGQLIQLKGDAVEPGMSGAPLLDEDDDRVVGMITSGRNSMYTRYVYATPSDQIVALYPELQLVPALLVDPPGGNYVARPDEYGKIVEALTRAPQDSLVGITTALRGAGGFGKTVLAQQVCQDERVWRAFPHGQLMVTLGEHPSEAELIEKVRYLIYKLTKANIPLPDLRTAASEWKAALEGRRVLVVLDDVWSADQFHLFIPASTSAGFLITTRLDEVLPVETTRVQVDEMGRVEAAALLGSSLPEDQFRSMLPELGRLAGRMGRWPLLLKLANAQLNRLSLYHPPEEALQRLERLYDRRGLTAFDANNPLERTQAAGITIRVSLDALGSEDAARFLELAVFPENAAVPLAAAAALWSVSGLDEEEAERLCERFDSSSLFQRYDPHTRVFTLHDVLQKYVLEQAGDHLGALHTRLLEGYARLCQSSWAAGPDDGYFFDHLAYHLSAAGRVAERNTLLLDDSWIKKRVQRGELNGLIGDYEYNAVSDAAALVQGALRLSAHVLGKDPAQLEEQLLGRLLGFTQPEITALLRTEKTAKTSPWLCPTAPCLPPPGGPERFSMTGHMDEVETAAFSADGRFLVSGSIDSTIMVWDATNGILLSSIFAHPSGVSALALSADDTFMVSGDHIGLLKLWEMPGGVERLGLEEMKTKGGAVKSIVITTDGRRAISGSWDGYLQSWDLTSGKNQWTVGAHERDIVALALSPDGQRVHTGSHDKTMSVRNAITGKKIRAIKEKSSFRAVEAFSADGEEIVSRADDGTLQVWDMVSGKIKHKIQTNNFWTDSLAFLSDGERIAAISIEGALAVWNKTTGEQLGLFAGAALGAKLLAVHPQKDLVVTGSKDGILKLWDLKAIEHPLNAAPQGSPINAVAVSPDGQWVVSGAIDGSMKVWDTATGEERQASPAGGHSIRALAITPEGRYVVCGQINSPVVRIWDLVDGTMQYKQTECWDGMTSICVTPDGRELVCGSAYDQIYRFDLNTMKRLHRYEGHRDEVVVAVTPDGKSILSGGQDGGIRLWDLATGKRPYKIEGKNGYIYALAITPDGQRFLSGAWDGTLTLWNLADGTAIRVMQGHEDGVYSVALTPDGRFALSAGKDRTIRVWRLETGEQICGFSCAAAVNACVITPDGQTVVAGDAAGRMYFLHREGW